MVDVGAVVAGHRLVKAIGSGPFGLVYRAEDARRRPLAIKFLKPGFLARADGAAAYGRLGASTAVHSQLAHPYLARVFGTVADRQQHAFGQVGEYLEGVALHRVQIDPRVLRGNDPQGLAELIARFEQMGDILCWLHAQGMVHGNLKPTNVLLVHHGEEQHVKLLDLSWSAIGVAAVSRGPNSYVSPEQYDGAVPDHLSDQWAMATMLERTFTGGHHRLALGVLPAALVQAVQRATQIDPKRRFRSTAELVEALREIRRDLQLAAGEAGQLPYGASTLPAGEVPPDLADAYPRSGDADSPIPVTTVDVTHPAASDLHAPQPDWNSGEKTLPYIDREFLGGRDLPPLARSPRARAAATEDEPSAPLVRHAVGDVLGERSSMATAGDTLQGVSRPDLQSHYPMVGSASSGEIQTTAETTMGLDAPLTGHPMGVPLGTYPAADVPITGGHSYSDGVGGSSGRDVFRGYSEVPSFALNRSADTEWSVDEAPSEPEASLPVEAAPAPVWLSRLAGVVVVIAALGVGAWSLTQQRGVFTPAEDDIVITTATVSAATAVDSPVETSSAAEVVVPNLEPVSVPEEDRAPLRPKRRRRRRPRAASLSMSAQQRSAPGRGSGAARRRSPPAAATAKQAADESATASVAPDATSPPATSVEDAEVGDAPSVGDATDSACKNGDLDACMKLGATHTDQDNPALAAGAYTRACELGGGQGCMRAARLWSRQRRGAQAREMFLQACKADVAEGCHQASIRTVGTRSQALKARACSLGRTGSCETRSSSTTGSLKVQ